VDRVTAASHIDWGQQPATYDASAEAEVPGPLNRAAAPGFGGGAYLPADEDAIEIARISLASTLGDDISIRARPVADGYEYLVVDDLGTTFEVPQPVRPGTLTLRGLMDLIAAVRDHDNEIVGLTDDWWDVIWPAWEDTGEPADFISLWSPFYPQFEDAYLEQARAWTRDRAAADARSSA
jgi:hypothetical protein